MKNILIVVWTVAGLLSCVAIGCHLGYNAGYGKGVDRATACASQDGVLLHDGEQYFCMYE